MSLRGDKSGVKVTEYIAAAVCTYSWDVVPVNVNSDDLMENTVTARKDVQRRL